METDKLTELIIACAYQVHNTLGAGFLEKVYENALLIELKKHGLKVKQQHPIPVFYEDQQVGDFYADLIVNNDIVIELKAVEKLLKQHDVQLVNYLNGIEKDIGLLINFGSSVTIKRKYRRYKKVSP
ncbi:GxxExxY protein [Marinilabiliaceae bacterium JC017]|nr:GxxExxY protein [Marinilabiliaceae bacterium JC017]